MQHGQETERVNIKTLASSWHFNSFHSFCSFANSLTEDKVKTFKEMFQMFDKVCACPNHPYIHIWYLESVSTNAIYIIFDVFSQFTFEPNMIYIRWSLGNSFSCEAQGKGRAKGRPRNVTKRSFMDGGWWLVVYLSLMLYTKFGWPTFPPTVLLLISRIKLFMGQVR